jgi:putative DNA primase/helicase
LKAALSYARRGQRVFPCGENKAPLIGGGFKNATTDRTRIHAFWSRWPAARVGLPTGEKFFVVDVDRLEALGELPAELPRTWTVRTPSGGLHYYFQAVEGLTNSPGNLPKGIDVRGLGGYVIGPPSPGYNVIDRTPLASAPDWLLKIIRGPRKPEPPPRRNGDPGQTTLDLDGPPILEGSRHTTLTSVAGRLHDGTRDAGQLIADLLAVNDARCTPPLEFEEVAAIATWTASKEPCSSGRPAELVAMIDRLGEAWYGMERRGLGGKGEVRLVRLLLEEGNRVGTVVEDGLRISMSLRQMAEKLSCGVGTVRAVRDRLAARGLLRVDNSEVGRRTATGTGSAALVLIARDDFHTPPTDPLAKKRIGGGVWKSSRPSAATLETGHYRHLGPVGYSREDTLCHVESRPGSTREALAALMGWSRPRDLEARHLRPLQDFGLIEEREGRWTVADRYAEAQQDAKRIAYSTIQMRSARQMDQESGRWVHFVTESGSVASQEKREEWDIERHRQQRALWKLTLATKKAAAEEAAQPGRVVVEHDGYLVDVETGEVLGDAVRSGWDPDEPTDRTEAA